MTPNDNPPTQSVDITGLAVAMGRVEEKLTGMAEKENKTGDRLDKIDQRLTALELNIAANVRPKTPWYNVVAGIGVLVLLAINAWTLFNLGVDLASLTP